MFKRYLHKEIDLYKSIMNDKSIMVYHYNAFKGGSSRGGYQSLYFDRLAYLEAISEYVIGKKYVELAPLWPTKIVSSDIEFRIEF